jgi:DNA-binding beta-propeller fold protein YncE
MRPNGRVVTTLAGTGDAGAKDGPGASATFSGPAGLVVDRDGSLLVCDAENSRIRRITAAGVVSTVTANFAHPQGIAINAAGTVFVADRDRHHIAKVAADGTVTPFVGSGSAAFKEGVGTEAAFNEPVALVFDKAGTMYVVDSHNHCIRKVTPDGRTSLFAGDGTAGTRDGLGTAARLTHPHGIAIDGDGTLYVSEEGTGKVRKIAPDGRVTTLPVQFGQAWGLAIDAAGTLFVADLDRHVIRRVHRDGVADVFAGDGVDRFRDGTGTAASFDGPSGLAFDTDNRLYVAEVWNHRVRRVE